MGTGHTKEGGGRGDEGTLPSAHRAHTFSGVWGNSPLRKFFLNLDAQSCHLLQSGGNSEASKLNLICTTLFTIIFNKMTKPASLLTQSSFVVMRFATKIR